MHLSLLSRLLVLLGTLPIAARCAGADAPKLPIRVGIIGLDAHAVPFTEIITGPTVAPPISDLKVAAAVPAYMPTSLSAQTIFRRTPSRCGGWA